MSINGYTANLLFQCKVAKLPTPTTELTFAPPRRWRFDVAWPEHRLAVEVEGAVYRNGRHTRGSGFTADCVKYAEATIRGWRVIRATSGQVKDGTALGWIERALAASSHAEQGS
jgi:hypothetical protein